MSEQEEIQLLKQQLQQKDAQLTKEQGENERKMKLNEFRTKRQIADITNELEAEKKKVQNVQENSLRLETLNNELQQKLTDLEASNLKLIEENTNLKKNRKASTSSEEDIKNEKFIPRKSMIQRMGDLDDVPTYQDLINLLQQQENTIQSSSQEILNLQSDIQSKDDKINLLQEQIKIAQIENDTIINELKKQQQTLEEKLSQSLQFIQQLRDQCDTLKQEKEQQYSEFMEKMKDIAEIDDNRANMDNVILDTETKFQRLMMIQEEQFQNKQQELLEQLQQTETRFQQYEQQIQNLEQQHRLDIKKKSDELNLQLQQKTTQISQIQKQLQDDVQAVKNESNKQINEIKQEHQAKLTQLQSELSESKKAVTLEQMKNKKLELDRKRKEDQIQELKDQIAQAEQEYNILKEKSNNMIDQYEQKLRDQLQINSDLRQQEHQELNHHRTSDVQSTTEQLSFEIEYLKAQIEQLKSKGDIELQQEINRLNERERHLKKEIVDLQNDLGTSRMNLTLIQRKLETEIERLMQDVEIATKDQSYAEQQAANSSILYANLAMEFEGTILQNRQLRKELAKYKPQK
ncbi:hypothetical protein pb186bvf_011701 [Paramecium bursaria]